MMKVESMNRRDFLRDCGVGASAIIGSALISQRAAARDLRKAQERADDAESYAEIAVEFAYLAVAEAGAAILDAIEARARAISLEETA